MFSKGGTNIDKESLKAAMRELGTPRYCLLASTGLSAPALS
jgi:hypothetical protein